MQVRLRYEEDTFLSAFFGKVILRATLIDQGQQPPKQWSAQAVCEVGSDRDPGLDEVTWMQVRERVFLMYARQLPHEPVSHSTGRAD